MEFIKTFWPTPFKVKEKDIASLVVQLIIFIVACAIAGVLLGVLAKLPVIGFVFGIVGGLLGVYNLVGIVLCILQFFGSLK